MGLNLFALGENPGAFHHHIDAQLAPRQISGIAFGEHPDVAVADIDAGLGDFHRPGELAMHGVVLQ